MKAAFVSRCLACIWLCTGTFAAHAAIAWDESGSGDLSGNGLSPTPVSLATGSNQVLGTTGNNGSGVDRDYFRITVPPGASLTSILLLDNTSISGSFSFIGIQPGTQVTVSTSGGGSQALIAQGHYESSHIGSDLMPNILVGATPPLPSGTYSVWVQETGGPASYGLDFVVSPTGGGGATVPTLPEWGMLLLATLLALAVWGRQATRASRRG